MGMRCDLIQWHLLDHCVLYQRSVSLGLQAEISEIKSVTDVKKQKCPTYNVQCAH